MRWIPALLAILAPGWVAAAPLSLPPAQPVVDEFRLMSAAEDAQLDQVVREIKQTSGVEVTVFIPATLQDHSIEDFAIDVARQWGLGKKKEDRGLLLLIAPKEKQMRLEVGGGLEGDVTDLFARHVLDDGLRPFFRQGRYLDGILSALHAIQEKVPLGLSDTETPAEHSGGVPTNARVLLLFFLVFWILSRLSRFGGGRWGGGGFFGGGLGGGGGGGGSWGGGGGGFSGGGSSSSW